MMYPQPNTAFQLRQRQRNAVTVEGTRWEWISCIRRSAQTRATSLLLKLAPWSEYSVAGIPRTGHRGSILRRIACRKRRRRPHRV